MSEKPEALRVDTDVTGHDNDTRPMKRIQVNASALSAEESAPTPLVPRSVGFDPYSRRAATEEAPKKGRRTLDDMRKLSEEIKKNRQK
jgi:hypothetical protein